MAVKVGNSWVSEAAMAYAKEKVNASSNGSLDGLSNQYPEERKAEKKTTYQSEDGSVTLELSQETQTAHANTNGVSSQQEKQSFQNTKELIEYLKQNYNTVSKGMVSISGMYLKDCLSDESKLKQLFDNLEVADDMETHAKDDIKGYQGMKIEIDENGDMTTETHGGVVAFNEGKRARQLAAAKTPENVQTVMSILQTDLADCQAGLESGMCDENEVNKVKAMIAKAQKRLSEVSASGDEENNADENAFAMSMLM